MEKVLKVAVLVSHPIQYFVPVFKELAKAQSIDLKVLYRTRAGVDEYHDPGFGQTFKWDIPLLDGYSHRFLSKRNTVAGFQWGVMSVLWRSRFDVLMVHGYNSITNLMAILVARIRGTKVLMRGDTRLEAAHQESTAKSLFKRYLFKLCDGFVAVGSLNRAYYLWHGVSSDQVFFAPFCVNNNRFAAAAKLDVGQRSNARAALGIASEAPLVLFASKLVRRKRAADLIHAFAALMSEFPATSLIIAGAGEEEPALRALAESVGGNQIRFVGFQNQSELPAMYAAADVFVLPSDAEPWGLVINEVMAAGVPVIVSSEVGAAPDLVEGKGTGIVFPCGDVDALADALRELLASSELRQKMGERGREVIREWDVDKCAEGIVNAACAVTARA
jgi:glycosyltransferase involved in cell wall biosynthesis